MESVLAALEELGVEFEAMDCDPDFADTAAFCERYGVAPEESANTIIVVGKSDPDALLAVPGAAAVAELAI